MKFIKGPIQSLSNIVTRYKGYLKTTFLYLFSSMFMALIGIAINPLLAKNLSPTDYAIMGYFNSFNFIIIPILNFSLLTFYQRNYFKIKEEERQKVTDTILFALLVFGFLALIVSSVGFYLYFKWSKVSFPFYPYAILTFIPVYLTNFQSLYLLKCRLNREAGNYSIVTIISALLSTILSILFVVTFKYGATGRLFALVAASLIVAIYCFSKMFKQISFDKEILMQAVRFGWPISISAILWYFLSGIDRAMLENINDNYNFGLYNVGIQIASYLAIVHTTIALTFDPDIYKAIADKKKRKLVKIFCLIFVFNAIPNILFIVFAPFVIGILTAHRYTNAAGFAQILALKNITMSVYFVLTNIIIGYGFTKSELFIKIIGAILSVLLFHFLIDRYSFYGAAWGQVISFAVISVLVTLFLAYKYFSKELDSKNI